MSSVRMCDEASCGLIFSENEEGWATAEVSRRVWNARVERYETRTDQEDRCPKHSGQARAHPVPQISLPGEKDVVQ